MWFKYQDTAAGAEIITVWQEARAWQAAASYSHWFGAANNQRSLNEYYVAGAKIGPRQHLDNRMRQMHNLHSPVMCPRGVAAFAGAHMVGRGKREGGQATGTNYTNNFQSLYLYFMPLETVRIQGDLQ